MGKKLEQVRFQSVFPYSLLPTPYSLFPTSTGNLICLSAYSNHWQQLGIRLLLCLAKNREVPGLALDPSVVEHDVLDNCVFF